MKSSDRKKGSWLKQASDTVRREDHDPKNQGDGHGSVSLIRGLWSDREYLCKCGQWVPMPEQR